MNSDGVYTSMLVGARVGYERHLCSQITAMLP